MLRVRSRVRVWVSAEAPAAGGSALDRPLARGACCSRFRLRSVLIAMLVLDVAALIGYPAFNYWWMTDACTTVWVAAYADLFLETVTWAQVCVRGRERVFLAGMRSLIEGT